MTGTIPGALRRSLTGVGSGKTAHPPWLLKAGAGHGAGVATHREQIGLEAYARWV